MKPHDRNVKPSPKNATSGLIPHKVEKNELFWIRKDQQNMGENVKDGKYKRLCPKMGEGNVYLIRGRRWMKMSYNKREVIAELRARQRRAGAEHHS